jgi:hypothetical protein
MAKFITLLVLLSIRLLDNEPNRVPAGLVTVPGIVSAHAELISFTATIKENKILLQWIISKNETVDRFEIERSADRKNFALAALVLCSEKSETDYYKFMDRSTGKKTFYRVKIINKDGSIKYSASLEIDPAAKLEPIEQTKTNADAYYC